MHIRAVTTRCDALVLDNTCIVLVDFVTVKMASARSQHLRFVASLQASTTRSRNTIIS